MDPIAHQISKRRVDGPLPGDTAYARKMRALDLDGEMALARAVMTGMAAVHLAIVDHRQPGGGQCRFQTPGYFGGDRAGGKFAHARYMNDSR